MAWIAMKGVLSSLLGNGWKSVAFGLLLAMAGLVGYSAALKRAIPPSGVTQQLQEVNREAIAVQSAVHSSTARARKSTEKINHVLENHRKWSDQPVPSDVVDELCRKINCGEDTSSVSTPDGQPKHARGARKRNQ